MSRCLGERKGRPLGVREVQRIAPCGEGEQPFICLAGPPEGVAMYLAYSNGRGERVSADTPSRTLLIPVMNSVHKASETP